MSPAGTVCLSPPKVFLKIVTKFQRLFDQESVTRFAQAVIIFVVCSGAGLSHEASSGVGWPIIATQRDSGLPAEPVENRTSVQCSPDCSVVELYEIKHTLFAYSLANVCII